MGWLRDKFRRARKRSEQIPEWTRPKVCTCNVGHGYRCDLHPRKAMRRRQMTQGGLA